MRPDVDKMTDAEVRAELRRRGVRPVAGAQQDGDPNLPDDFAGGGDGSQETSLIGQYVMDYNTGRAGRLTMYEDSLTLFLVDGNGQRFPSAGPFIDGLQRVHLVNVDGRPTTSRSLRSDELQRFGFVAQPQSAGRAPPAYSSTRQAALDQQAWEEDQAQRNRDWQEAEAGRNRAFEREEADRARYNQERMTAIGEIGDLAVEAGRIKQQARDLRAQVLGTDQFRAAAFAAGGPTMGTTPVAAFRNELLPAATSRTPTIDYAAALPALRRQQRNLTRFVGEGLPQAPVIGGLAEGGVIDMKKRPNGKFAAVSGAGAQGFSVLLGEGLNGEGLEMGTAEIMTVKDDKITITPFAGGAAQGGEYTYPGTETSPSSLSQAIAPLLGAVGFNEMPVYTRNALTGMSGPFSAQGYGQGVPRRRTGQAAEFLQRLGVNPRVIRDPNSGSTFYANAEGELFTIGAGMQGGLEGLRRFGFGDARDVVSLTPQEMGEFGFSAAGGGSIPAPLQTGDLSQIGMGGESSFGRFPAPIMLPVAYNESGEPTSFIPLPDPSDAQFMARFRRMDEGTQNLVLDAYGFAGFGAQRALERQRYFTPTGSASAAGAARLG